MARCAIDGYRAPWCRWDGSAVSTTPISTPHRSIDPSAAPIAPPPPVRLWPGLLTSLAVAGVSMIIARPLPGISALIVAIVAGIVVANTVGLPTILQPGSMVAAKRLLRIGIVLLGLQVVIGDLLGLGVGALGVVVAVVAGGIGITLALGRLLGIPRELTLLVACGFSICGAAAVAGASGVTDPEEKRPELTATALALVVLFGTGMIALIPFGAAALGLDEHSAGLWAGASIHEVAQVVAAGGAIGGGALTVAVIVKLARVLMLAPVMAGLSLYTRRVSGDGGHRPPIMPLFVAGFLAMVVLGSLVPLPSAVLSGASFAQTLLLAAAMFALGTGVRIRDLLSLGPRPVLLAAASTAAVTTIALAGIILAS
ncbi:YeiH family protein [Brachybacterium sp. UMB0905]|uniref:YeiH family protein n=1 Tax=Brachybacterium sp. UMB0905 TaxID=2069310 RepID=UPI000C7FBBF8|nr:putative sulfate exporter family transporter [Brachybacterium sp. UMB0905]PMC75448.1 putative sulfate exporter family transporter [Brachybacterium sp. UMB0905]